MIALDGLPALSAFRIDRLNTELARQAPDVRVRAAWHVYFVDADATAGLDPARLCAVIQAQAGTPRAATLWVVPRLGTRSPWSSKASDILADCAFPVRRIERGIAFDIEGAMPADDPAWPRIARALHDPMTQSVIAALADAQHLFDAGAPAPLARIALGADPRRRSTRPTRLSGLRSRRTRSPISPNATANSAAIRATRN